jgi:hypothetical protein
VNCRRILCDENPLGHSSNDRPSRSQVIFDRDRSPFTPLTRRDRSDGTCEAMSNGGSWAISEIRKCPLLEKTTGSKGSNAPIDQRRLNGRSRDDCSRLWRQFDRQEGGNSARLGLTKLRLLSARLTLQSERTGFVRWNSDRDT